MLSEECFVVLDFSLLFPAFSSFRVKVFAPKINDKVFLFISLRDIQD